MGGGGSVVVDFLFIVTPIVGVCNCSMFCCMLLYVHSSIAIILMGKRELIVLLNLSSWCLVMVERLFLAVPRGCLQFVIVVFPYHTHLLFFMSFFFFFFFFWRGVCPGAPEGSTGFKAIQKTGLILNIQGESGIELRALGHKASDFLSLYNQ